MTSLRTTHGGTEGWRDGGMEGARKERSKRGKEGKKDNKTGKEEGKKREGQISTDEGVGSFN